MAHFFGAVSEIRTSGLIPSWLGSSTSQPEEDRKEKWGTIGGLWHSACCVHTQQVMYLWYDELTLIWLQHEIYAPHVPEDLENACLGMGAKAQRELTGGPSIMCCFWASRLISIVYMNTYLTAHPHWQWGSWFASGWPEYQSKAP